MGDMAAEKKRGVLFTSVTEERALPTEEDVRNFDDTETHAQMQELLFSSLLQVRFT